MNNKKSQPNKKIVENTFLDWRPVASIPIENGVMVAQDWRPFLPKERQASALKASNDLSEPNKIEFRYCCRIDGLIVIQIRSAAHLPRALVSLCAEVSDEIKSECGHFHVFHGPNTQEATDELSTLPILCEKKNFSDFDKFLLFTQSDDELRKLRAYSINRNRLSDEKASLALKKLYSSVFDRACKRTAQYDRNSNLYGRNSFTPKTQALMMAYGLVVFILSALGLSLNTKFEFIPQFKLVSLSLITLMLGLGFVHVRYNLNGIIFKKIRLHRALIGYSCHGNNLARVLWNLFMVEKLPPNNEFDPVVKIAENLIDAAVRRINTYYFTYSIAVAAVALVFSFLG